MVSISILVTITSMTREHDDIFAATQEVIELIRPSIQADGGDIELVSVDEDGIVTVRFTGACMSCPSLDMTLQGSVETTLKKQIPSIKCVKVAT